MFGADDPASVDRFVGKYGRGCAGCSRAGSDEFGKTIYPHQFIECAAQPNQEVDIKSQLSVPGLRASTSHPPEDVRSSAELLNRTCVRICNAEISKKAANGPARVTNGFGSERGAVEGISQRVLKRKSACAIHDRFRRRGHIW